MLKERRAAWLKIRFQVARAAEKLRGIAAAESIENGGARVVLPQVGRGGGGGGPEGAEKEKGVFKERPR